MCHPSLIQLGIRRALVLGILVSGSLPAYSGEAEPAVDPDDDFLDLSLDELSNFSVTVASTKAETISATPAIVSRYSPAQLNKLGIRKLKDMLELVPGVVTSTILQGHQAIMIRGLAEAFNQKVLFLIDDIPYWMPSNSDIPLLGIPMEAINHVEVIRGPGAVYYGTNASAGVIKIVTRKGGDSNSLTATAGSNSRVRGGGYFSHQFGEDSTLSVAFEAQKDDGFVDYFENMAKRPPASGYAESSENYRSVLARFNYKNFNATAQAFTSETQGIAPPSSAANTSVTDYQGFLVAADYKWELENTNLKFFSDYSQFDPEHRIDSFFGPGLDANVGFYDPDENNYRWRTGGTIDYRFSPSLALFAGAEHERRAQGDFTAVIRNPPGPVARISAENELTENALYGQLDYTSGDWRYLLGVRWVDNEQTGSNVMPRLSTIYKLDERQSIKFLYSAGFNSPNFLQSSARSEGIVTANAAAETVESFDLAFTHTSGNTLFVANAYYLTLSDPIRRIFANGIINFGNGEEFDRYGFELDFQHKIDDINILANMSYNHQGDKLIDNDSMALYAPRYVANLGVDYSFGKHTVGGALRYISERAAADRIVNLNLNYQYAADGYELFATLGNVLDDGMEEPDLGNLNPEGVAPGDVGRNIAVGVRINF
jgi:outer membrane receptor protein involved in Fe transport